MRYPEGNRRSNSITISADSSSSGDNRHHHPIRFPSSSTASQDSHYQEDVDNDLHLPGRTAAASDDNDNSVTNSSGGGVGRANIETISEHVLFGNNNGHNSFLYLYYSSSSTHRNNSLQNNSDHNLRRPYTTGGGGFKFKGEKVMGSSQEQQGVDDPLQKWNDLSGVRGSARPSPVFSNNNEEDDDYCEYDDEKGKLKPEEMNGKTDTNGNNDGSSSIRHDNELTPYPVYLSPVEGSPIRLPSLSPKKKSGDDEDEDEETRSSSIFSTTRQYRLDSFGADLLEDDWDKIYSVPDVDARYIMSPEPNDGSENKMEAKRKQSEIDSEPMNTSSPTKDHQHHHHHHHEQHHHRHQHHHHHQKHTTKQNSTTSSNNLSVSRTSLQPSTNSPSRTTQGGSLKRVRGTPHEVGGRGVGGVSRGNSMKQWSSTSSVSNKLTPLSSNPGSRTPSTRSLRPGNATHHHHHHHHHNNHHGVTHHHHKPLSGVPGNDDQDGKRASSTTAGDGLDQMSFQFQNGIGAFFGTAASRLIAHKDEPTPEEMYEEEMQGLRPRLATGATIFTAILLILSCASLLFVFPILVDPILVGFEAEFSKEPVMCRTTNFRNGSGPSECATPSCREGCTLDLFSCIFIDVEYYALSNVMNDNLLLEPRNDSVTSTSAPAIINTSDTTTTTTTTPTPKIDTGNSTSTFSQIGQKRSAILLINVNGCGYRPYVTCSDFEKNYAPLNTQFPCYYSQHNESIVVPDYSRRTEIIHLTLSICVPFGIIFVSAISLYLLVRYHKYLKRSILRKYGERKKELRAKWREEAEKERNEMKLSNDTEQNVDEDATFISELEPSEEYNYRKNIKATQNGMQNGVESSRNVTGSDIH